MEWYAAKRSLDEHGCGDGFLVVEKPKSWLVALVDALGHGTGAEVVMREALRHVEKFAHLPIGSLFEQVHIHLAKSRGVAMSVVEIGKDSNRLRWAGVGNVEAILIGTSGNKYVVGLGGVVGYQLPMLRVSEHAFASRDLLVLHTDGVENSLVRSLERSRISAEYLDELLAKQWSKNDDALLFVGKL